MAELTLPPRSRLIAHDLKRTLIHECGHLIVGDHVGVEKSFARFWLYEDADPANDHLVGGQSSYFPPLRGRAMQLMGVAGLVAECLADEEDFSSVDILDWIDGNIIGMSATDREGAGEIDEALLDDCAGILRRRWTDLIAEAVHFLGRFETSYAADAEVAEAASAVRDELEGLRDRFTAMFRFARLDVGLTWQAAEALVAHSIRHEDLLSMRLSEIRRLRGIGKVSMAKICAYRGRFLTSDAA